MSGGFSRGAKTRARVSGVRRLANLASTPAFLIRNLGLLDPAKVESPANRQQRRARAAQERSK